MKTNKTLLSCAVAFGLASVSTFTQAAGFQLAEYSATGLGRAYASMKPRWQTMPAHNGATPAMLTYLEGTQVSLRRNLRESKRGC